MTIEAQLDRLNQNIETLLKTLQPLAQQPPAQQPPAQQPPAQQPPAATVPTQPAPAPAPAAQAAQTAAPPIGVPGAQSAAPPAVQPPAGTQPQPQSQPDNVVPMSPAAATGPALSLDQLNNEIMAVVAQLGGNQSAAAQVMNVMSSKYGTSSLRQLREDQYRPLLNDVQALTQKAGG